MENIILTQEILDDPRGLFSAEVTEICEKLYEEFIANAVQWFED